MSLGSNGAAAAAAAADSVQSGYFEFPGSRRRTVGRESNGSSDNAAARWGLRAHSPVPATSLSFLGDSSDGPAASAAASAARAAGSAPIAISQRNSSTPPPSPAHPLRRRRRSLSLQSAGSTGSAKVDLRGSVSSSYAASAQGMPRRVSLGRSHGTPPRDALAESAASIQPAGNVVGPGRDLHRPVGLRRRKQWRSAARSRASTAPAAQSLLLPPKYDPNSVADSKDRPRSLGVSHAAASQRMRAASLNNSHARSESPPAQQPSAVLSSSFGASRRLLVPRQRRRLRSIVNNAQLPVAMGASSTPVPPSIATVVAEAAVARELLGAKSEVSEVQGDEASRSETVLPVGSHSSQKAAAATLSGGVHAADDALADDVPIRRAFSSRPRSNPGTSLARHSGDLVVELVCALVPFRRRVPLDCKVAMTCVEAQGGVAISNTQVWPPRGSRTVPVCWNQCRLFEPNGMDGTNPVDDDDHLLNVVVSVPGGGLFGRSSTWTGLVRLGDLAYGRVRPIDCQNADTDQSIILYVIRREHNRSYDQKIMFFIRHGESLWNEAQGSRNFGQMMSDVDHGLSAMGMAEAEQLMLRTDPVYGKEIVVHPEPELDESTPLLNSLDEHAVFASASHIFCSPLTRALQTALLVLAKHPALYSHGIKLEKNLREIKSMGGLDTMGTCIGEKAIRARVLEKLREALPPASRASTFGFIDRVPIDAGNASSKWWTTFADTKESVERRMDNFLLNLRFVQASAVIVVGHSLYFRRLVANYASPAARDLSSSWQLLSDFKLENCGVAMAQLDLAEITGNADTQRREAIQEVKLAFGSAVKR